MPQRRTVTNPLALVVLAWLLAGPSHPYELSRRFEEAGVERYVKYTRSSLYMVVTQLAKAGFVAEQETVRDTRWPERTLYAITDAGRTGFHEWMRVLLAEPKPEYPKFGVAVSLLGGMDPAEVVELLTARRTALTAHIDRLHADRQTAADSGLEWVFMIEVDYQIATLETEERFVGDLVTALADPAYRDRWESWQQTHS